MEMGDVEMGDIEERVKQLIAECTGLDAEKIRINIEDELVWGVDFYDRDANPRCRDFFSFYDAIPATPNASYLCDALRDWLERKGYDVPQWVRDVADAEE